MTDLTHTGVVKFYDARKNDYGFIADDNGGPDIYVHANVLGRCGIRRLMPGERVRFAMEPDRDGKRPHATAIEFLP